jgi:hypothetical protein
MIEDDPYLSRLPPEIRLSSPARQCHARPSRPSGNLPDIRQEVAVEFGARRAHCVTRDQPQAGAQVFECEQSLCLILPHQMQSLAPVRIGIPTRHTSYDDGYLIGASTTERFAARRTGV